MSPLSSAAKAVLDAYWKSPWDPSLQHEDRAAIAAAIRALANHLLPEEPQPDVIAPAHIHFLWQERQYLRRESLAIAAELERAGDG